MGTTPFRVEPSVPTPPPDPWLLAWADLRRRQIAVVAGLGLLPVTWAISSMAHISAVPIYLAIVALTILVAAGISGFRCPNCGQRFCRKGLYHNEFARRCLHCGLRVGTPKGA